MAKRDARSGSSKSSSRQPSPAPVTTTISWDGVVGARLEELLYGLLDEMGSQDLIWRAGSATGVTAADSGRDIEAVFSRPSPDGSVELTRWWVEAKGRSSTVKKRDVVDSVVATLARPDVDVFVFCTNSRFSNPTRDWVSDWQRAHPRPQVRLWDRDDLGRFVRRYPLVAARTVPEALDVATRLALLVDRFETLGESPTIADLDFFWAHPEALAGLETAKLISAIAMFVYADTDHGLVERPWASLLQTDPLSVFHLAVHAVGMLPAMLLRERARPIDENRLTATAAYLLLAAMASIHPETLLVVLENPNQFLQGMEFIANDTTGVKLYLDARVRPIWSRVQNELMDVCGDDCRRFSSDPGAAFPQQLVGERYWRRFGVGDEPNGVRLTFEWFDQPCTVGLSLDRDRHCPLGTDAMISLERVTELVRIVRYRRANPGNHAYDGVSISDCLPGGLAPPDE